MSRAFIRAALLLLCQVAVVNCGGGGAVVPTDARVGSALASLAVTPSVVSVAVGSTVTLQVQGKDANGTTVTLPSVTYTSANGSIASVEASGVVHGIAPGSTSITVSATINAATVSTDVPVTVGSTTVGAPAIVTTSGTSFVPSTVTIDVGGSVTWQIAGNTHNVTFGANKPVGGDVPNTPSGGTASRVFTVAGSYPYQCTLHSNMTGTVIVQGGGGNAGTFSTLSLTPSTPFVTVGGTAQLTATPLDANGTALSGLGTPTFQSSNNAIAAVNASGLVTGVANGNATITASLTSNGITRTATSTVTVGVAAATVVTTGNAFIPNDVTINVGGTVVWQFNGTHNVTFEDRAPPGGNIPTSTPGSTAARTFTTAGDYDYECTIHDNMKGRIRVR